jgi:hypothetical protein
MSTKYVARLNGKIVGKRTTATRTYTHAIVVQRVQEYARDRAYNRSAEWVEQDRKNFAYYSEKAAAGVGHRHYFGDDASKSAEHARDVARTAAGLDAYIESNRQHAIKGYEDSVKAGRFEPFVAAWSGRLDLAHKAASQHTGQHCKLIAIVPAEEA